MAATATFVVPNMQLQHVIEQFWQSSLAQLSEGNAEIVLHDNVLNVIGQDGLSTIVERYSALIKARASAYHDQIMGVIRILPPPMFQAQNDRLNASPAPLTPAMISASDASSAGSPSISMTTAVDTPSPATSTSGRSRASRKGKSKIPRPPNAFILYRKHHHPLVKAQFPNMHNNEISMRLGRQWKNEDEDTKNFYRAKAEEVKRKHLQDHPEYQYQPRKPSEKKRRMTKRKAAALAELSQPSNLLTAQTSTTSGSTIGTPISTTASQTSAASPPVEEEVQIPDVIPDFQLSSDGRLLTHELVPFPDQDNTFAQMIDQHNTTAGLVDPNHMHATFFSFPTTQAAEDYAVANAIINHIQLEERAEADRAHMLAEIEKELSASGEVASAAPSSETLTVADPLNIFDQEWNDALKMLQNAEEHRMESLLQTPSAFEDAFIDAGHSSPNLSDINFDLGLEEYTT